MARSTRLVWLAGTVALGTCSSRRDDTPSRTPDTPQAQATGTSDSAAKAATTSDSVAKVPASKAPGSEWQIVPGRAGPVTIESSEAELRQHYGPSVVESIRVELGEGTSLHELERLNGRAFTLAGFGWDYAGVVTDWKGGALDSSLAGITLYLDPGPAQYQSKAYSQVLGDRDYSSSLPPMQQLNPHVGQIFVDFESP